MKLKLNRVFALVIAALLAFSVTACSSSSSSFSIESKMDNTIVINAENCDTETTGDGNIKVGSSEVIVVEPSLTSGSMKFRALASGKAEDAAADAEQEVSGSTAAELSVPEGEYTEIGRAHV